MNVTPKPAITALRADSCSPSSSLTSRSRSRTPAVRSSSSITWRTPAPSCISTSGSPFRAPSSVTVLSAEARAPRGHREQRPGRGRTARRRLRDVGGTRRRRRARPRAARPCSTTVLRVGDGERRRARRRAAGWNSAEHERAALFPPGPVDAPISSLRAPPPAPSSPEIGEQLLLHRKEALRAPVEAVPCLGRLHAASRTVEQLRPEPLLERADLQAHRRLGDPELLRRLGEAPPLDNGAERCKLLLSRSNHYAQHGEATV